MVRNKGFSIVEVLIVVLLVALIGFIGWKVWDTTQNQPAENTSQTTGQPDTTDVKTEDDLDTVDKTLNDTNIEGNEATQLENETSF